MGILAFRFSDKNSLSNFASIPFIFFTQFLLSTRISILENQKFHVPNRTPPNFNRLNLSKNASSKSSRIKMRSYLFLGNGYSTLDRANAGASQPINQKESRRLFTSFKSIFETSSTQI